LTSFRSFFSGFAGILGGEVFVQCKDLHVRNNFLKCLTERPAAHNLYARGDDRQLRLRRFQQDGGIVDRGGGQGVESGAAENFPEEGTDVERSVNADYAGADVAGLSGRIAGAEIGCSDGFFHATVGFKLRNQMGKFQDFADFWS